jgi:hypothetical protein
MEFVIQPRRGAGPLMLGMSRSQVQDTLSAVSHRFRRGPKAAPDADHFEALGVFVYYDTSDLVEAIELATPAKAILGSQDLLSTTFSEAEALLSARDLGVMIASDGLTSKAEGVGVWVPFAKDDPDAPVESVIVFVDGYYD